MKNRLIILGFIFLLPGIIFAQENSFRKLSFDARNQMTLEIDNSFGDIEVSTHGGKKIDITVEITVEARNEKREQDFLDNTTIKSRESGNTVSVETVRKKNNIKVDNFSIDYLVKIPKGTNLQINNRFGDVMIYEPGGHVDIDVSHGDCRLTGTFYSVNNQKNRVMVKFGELEVEYFMGGRMQVNHGDLEAAKVADADIRLQFSNGEIGLLEGEIDIDLSHSKLTVDDLGSKVKDLEAELKFSTLRIDGYATESFNSDMFGEFSKFKFPKDMAVVSEQPSMNSVQYKIRGKKAGANAPTMNIDASHSTVTLK